MHSTDARIAVLAPLRRPELSDICVALFIISAPHFLPALPLLIFSAGWL